MIYPDFRQFKKLAKQGNVIPVYREILADLETPVSAFLKIDDTAYSYLLESVESQENVGRYSFLSANPSIVFRSKGRRVDFIRLTRNGRQKRSYQCPNSPLDEVRVLMAGLRFVPVKGLPRFCGGFIGYVGYDMVRFFEKIPDKNPDELEVPDSVLMLSDTLVIFDHVNRKIKVVANAILSGHESAASLRRVYNESTRKIVRLVRKLHRPLKTSSDPIGPTRSLKIASNMTKQGFMKAVLRAKEYIKKGDIIQVVLSQRFKTRLRSRPFNIYRSLRAINPSPYMFYLKLDDLTLVGSSPELLVRCEEGVVATRPIAGTRPRGGDEKEDTRLAKELLADQKERAEHLMLVDLGRNDLGRVCRSGSVKVDEFMAVEKYSHVMHIVSHVVGRLKAGKDAWDALTVCFPAGTLSGAPKIRAMEIIDELENVRRGPYGGAIGYFSFSGNLDSCIIIRTIVIKKGQIFMQAGAGLVSDSDPEKEYNETLNKARAMLQAVQSAR